MNIQKYFAQLVVGTVLVLMAQLAVLDAPKAWANYSEGVCTADDTRGVSVVIDFQQLGGETIKRCVHNFPAHGTGFDALHLAGLRTAPTAHDGDGFICRINNRPSPTEAIPVKRHLNYKEKCIATPPAAAYWSYWHSPNGGSWTYSQFGVKNREAIIGGFEGWSFSLNATASTNPPPRVPPRRRSKPPTPKPTSSVKPTVKPNSPTPVSSPTAKNTPTSNSASSAPRASSMFSPTPSVAGSLNPSPSVSNSPNSTPSPTGSITPSGSPKAIGAPNTKDGLTPLAGSSPAMNTKRSGLPIGTIVGISAVIMLGLAGAGYLIWRRHTS